MSEHVCPVWVGYLLASPVRKLFHDPKKILDPYVKEGMRVLDVGSAMGFFSIPAAKMVGGEGRVICVDCQAKMLSTLEKRAQKAGVAARIDTRICSTDALGLADLTEQIDVALAVAMVHEAPDPERLLTEIAATLKPNGRLLIAEPKGHVSEDQIRETLRVTTSIGLTVVDEPSIKRTYSYWMARAA
jgi:ubiquinone/menaquinone biosynthesis C-methylase UbiE